MQPLTLAADGVAGTVVVNVSQSHSWDNSVTFGPQTTHLGLGGSSQWMRQEEKNITAHITTQHITTQHETLHFDFCVFAGEEANFGVVFRQIFVSELTAGVAEKHGSLLIAVTVGTGGELI